MGSFKGEVLGESLRVSCDHELIFSKVLDEADRLLTPTFSPELSYLFNVLPKDRQTCLFTATLTPAIETLIDAPPRPGKAKPFVHRMKERYVNVSFTASCH